MSKTPLLCIALLACVQAQSQSPFGNFFSGPLKPTFKYTGGYSGNVGAKYDFKNGNGLSANLHADLKNPGLINGFGIRGHANLGKGWYGGAHVNHGWGSNRGTGIGITLGKKFDFGRKRAIKCMSSCDSACRRSTEMCMKNCVMNMC
ncbi:Hypothetical predicted protein [Mytilus galloprovincialis]|uniref:Uncharacterized protein n=1 Tax=Mytilus galloprovincialis TaxID=29158 RepID=A0A8B6D9I4_MYTGA|nr:Hypothetical predicted protein [Mytilus galloprovincialis]